MTFIPVVPSGGIVGWRFLERTYDTQLQTHSSSAPVVRDVDYFRENIQSVRTADDLVADRRLMRVALGAFGLSEDINNTFFIKKILADGTTSDEALSNKLADSRYKDLAAAFAFDRPVPRTQLLTFPDEIIQKFHAQTFEAAVGDQDQDMRLALNTQREVAEIAAGTGSEDTKWFRILGSAPLRNVMETALGLPSSFAQLDLDQQLSVVKEKSQRQFGIESVADFADPEVMDGLIQRFLARSQIALGASSNAGSIALTLLRSVKPLF